MPEKALKVSDIRFSQGLNAYEVEFWHVHQRETAVSRQDLVDSARRSVAVRLLGHVRSKYSNLAVVFRDGNIDRDIFLKVNLLPFQKRDIIREVIGPNPLPHKPRRPSRVPYLIINLGTDDALGLSEGFVEECAPALFRFCWSGGPISTEDLMNVMTNSEDESQMLRGLLELCEVVLYPGPDADYFVGISLRESTLRSIMDI